MSAKDNLSPHQFSWDDAVSQHPEMGEHEDAVNYLAHAHSGDREAEESHVGNLAFEHRNVPLRSITFNSDKDNPRTRQAMYGYQAGGAPYMDRDTQRHNVPPVLLVKRGAKYEVADGHHRVTAAARMLSGPTHINAVVTKSPRKDPLPDSKEDW